MRGQPASPVLRGYLLAATRPAYPTSPNSRASMCSDLALVHCGPLVRKRVARYATHFPSRTGVARIRPATDPWREGQDIRRSTRLIATTLPSLTRALVVLQPTSLLVDVEPLVAPWKCPPADFVRALAHFCEFIHSEVSSVRELTALTNSSGTMTDLTMPGAATFSPFTRKLISRANKPWTRRGLRNIPGPRAVVGDQVLTDGLLAWRLRSAFIHGTRYQPNAHSLAHHPMAYRPPNHSNYFLYQNQSEGITNDG